MAPEQIADIPDVVSVPGAPIRERVVVRKRRSRKPHRSREWSARSSRRRAVRNVLLCTGVLLLMAAGVYLGLERQDGAAAPVEGSLTPAVAVACAASAG
jgi:hypothetical protein